MCERPPYQGRSTLEDVYRYSNSLVSQTDTWEKKMSAKLGYNPGRRFTQLYLTTENVNGQIRARKAKLRDYKLTKSREWMGVLFYSLLKCSEKGTAVATLCHAIVGNLSTKTTQRGGLRAHYPGGSHVKSLPVEVERKVETTTIQRGPYTRSRSRLAYR